MKPIAASQQPYRNCLLASLPASELQRLAPHLAPVSLPRDRTLHDSGEVIESVYFLEEGVSSVVITMQNGTTRNTSTSGFSSCVCRFARMEIRAASRPAWPCLNRCPQRLRDFAGNVILHHQMSSNGRSYTSDHKTYPSSARISRAATRSRAPDLRTLPSST
jgi:hypothetical protein